MKAARYQGFDKTRKLLNAQQFKRVFERGQTRRNPLFIMVSAPNDKLHARLGIIVSKKVSKKAVQRNRLKRLIRETFRTNQTQLLKHDFVIIARKNAVTADNHTLTETLAAMWLKTSK